MFNATFISSNSFTSKTGNPYYRIELIATAIDGSHKVVQEFCSAGAYEASKGIQSMSPCKVACGINEMGKITINAIKAE